MEDMVGRTPEFDREDVLDRALLLFWQKGFHATSIRDLVDVTGLGKASIYNAFGNKEQFFKTVLDRYAMQSEQAQLQRLDAVTPASEAIRIYFEDLIRFSVTIGPRLGCLYTNTAVELAPRLEKMENYLKGQFEKTEERLATTIRRGHDDGSIPTSVVPETTANILLNVAFGIRVQARLGSSEEKLRGIVEGSMAALLFYPYRSNLAHQSEARSA
ncbi:MAG: hypothetical protein COB90_06695 [Hyphomicrobiales bacterium]|nr:MAG: hypothetical protein COB90_06695 [Hyphomicrobiales bacterium]